MRLMDIDVVMEVWIKKRCVKVDLMKEKRM